MKTGFPLVSQPNTSNLMLTHAKYELFKTENSGVVRLYCKVIIQHFIQHSFGLVVIVNISDKIQKI